MVPKNAARAALFAVAGAFGCMALGAAAPAESFDKPVRKTIVDLGPSAYLMPGDHSRVQLYCAYYPDFMVKELDDPGLKGTEWVTITTIHGEHIPACHPSHGPEERFLAKEWWGFVGVKGPLLFLEAADGENGGMPFRVLNRKTEKDIFTDSIALPYYKLHDLDFVRTSSDELLLRYSRVVAGSCSIPKDGLTCWNKLRRKFGLISATAPACTGYEGEVPVPADEVQTPSAIMYSVEVKLSARPTSHAIAGPVRCRPVE
jgi:hypothetical protein